MNRLLAAPVGIAALLLLFFAAVSMCWIWLRMGRPEDPGAIHLALLLLPLAVLGIAAASAGSDDFSLARMTWLVFMVGAIWTGAYALRVGASAGSMAGVLGGDEAGAEAMAPKDLPPLATDPSFGKGFDQWPFGVVYGLMYAAMSVLFISWLAVWTSEVKPMPGTFAADERTVRARLLSLPAQIPQLQVEEGPAADEMRVVYRYRSGARNMQVRLWLDDAHSRIRSRIYTGIAGDKPLTAEEARMYKGPTSATDLHPDADIIWKASWVAVPRSAETREQLRLRLVENEVELPRRVSETFATDVGVGTELLPHILTEIAQQSGWTWRGGLLFF